MKIAAAAFLLSLSCVRPSWSGITITVQDGKSNPIQGVSCSQNAAASAVSDAAGKLTLTNITSVFNPQRGLGNIMLSQIPLSPGDKATVTVTNIRGQSVLSRSVSLGERVDFARNDRGVYFVNITSPRYSTRGRFVNFGRGIVFESVAVQGGASHALAKTDAANATDAAGAAGTASGVGAIITCGKTGYPTQVYQIPDGSSITIDFSKLTLVPLFDNSTALEPNIHEETPTAFITRWSDRARDRHAREDEYHIYDHYLAHYWEHRTAAFEFIDYVAKGGDHIDVKMTTEWELNPGTEEFRAFYRGIGTVAEYIHAPNMKLVPGERFKYTNTIDAFYSLGPNNRDAVRRPLKIGDKIEMEISQFLAETDSKGGKLVGRKNYYGTAVLYVVGKGFVPFETKGVFKDLGTEREDSYPLPENTWMGGRTTLPYQYSNEPTFRFMEMAQNLSNINGQNFVLGRRVLHTNFINGAHDEPDNPAWTENSGKGGPNYINTSCSACHTRNGHSLPPTAGSPLYTSVVKVGDAAGNPHPKMGSVLQPQSTGGGVEGYAKLVSWTETNGLRKPNYSFEGGAVPTHFSVRSTPQLVGMGLLEAIPEGVVQGMADPDDADKDGISGRMNIVSDPVTGLPHLGRFGWKAGKSSVKHQIAGAFNTDMGVMSSVMPKPDCGSEQTDCGNNGAEVADSSLKHLVDYISLLGVAARRDYQDPAALRGEALFASAGCAACHVPTVNTGAYHPKGELRNQTIHPYTDLLLHDMGPGLADNLPESLASGSEWRTAPLWSIGLAEGVSEGASFLHDGRARTIKEAILWHGGEGEKAANNFKAMPAADADALIRFLGSL
jgi:CxxC motif-containing protein (DUF1111 family)